MIDLYKNIKEQRILHGMSQEELAHKIGYADKTMISRIENGKIDLSQSKIEEFANIFDVTPGYLMGWDIPKENERKLKVSIVNSPIGFKPDHESPYTIQEVKDKISHIDTAQERMSMYMENFNNLNDNKASKALELYEKYEKADPKIKAAVEALLKDGQ